MTRTPSLLPIFLVTLMLLGILALPGCASAPERLANKDCPTTTIQSGFCTGCCDLVRP